MALAAYALGAGFIRLASCVVAGRAGFERAREDRGSRAGVRVDRPRVQRSSRTLVHRLEIRNLRGRVAFGALADGRAGGRRGAGDADGRGLRVGVLRAEQAPLDAGDADGGGGRARDHRYAPPRHAGPRALQRGLRAGRGLRLLRGAERDARRGPRRDPAHGAARRHLQADPLRRPAPPGGAAAGGDRAQDLRVPWLPAPSPSSWPGARSRRRPPSRPSPRSTCGSPRMPTPRTW